MNLVETQKLTASVYSRSVGVDWTYDSAGNLVGKLDAGSLYRGFHRKQMCKMMDSATGICTQSSESTTGDGLHDLHRAASSLGGLRYDHVDGIDQKETDGRERKTDTIDSPCSRAPVAASGNSATARLDHSVQNILGPDTESKMLTLNSNMDTAGLKSSDVAKYKSVVRRRINASLLLIINHFEMIQRMVYVPGVYLFCVL